MTSTFHGLEVAKRGLFAQQAGLNTVGQNVANANTPGYSRQRVNLAATPALEYPNLGRSTQAGQLGTGVTTQSIERVHEEFLDSQFRNENKGLGEWEVRTDAMDKLQAIFNEPSDTALSSVLNKFFLSWQKLGGNPDNLDAARSLVRQATIDVCATVNTMDKKLGELDADLTENIGGKVNEFNTYTQQLADINQQITTLEVLGDKANDLRDARDYIMDKLSKIADVTGREVNGVYTVTVGNTAVVTGNAVTATMAYDPATNTTTPPVTSGQIGGMIASRRDYVQVYRDQLNSMINGLVNGKMQVALPSEYPFDSATTTMPFDAVLPDGTPLKQGDPIPASGKLPKNTVITFQGINGLHAFGYTSQVPAKKAGALFETTDGSTVFTAGNIRVANDVLNDIRNLATSTVAFTDPSLPPTPPGSDQRPKVGNGDVAWMIGEAANSNIDFKEGLPPNGAILSKGPVSGYMRAIVAQMGLQGSTAENQVKNQEVLLNQIDNKRQSVSGVSIDEEMSNMIRFQQSYQAAARMVSTIDGLLDTIINRMKQ
ncbi:MAG: flagellar hook-associated protein FlgK [Tumebacillaceae bacterium]